jgi:glutamate/tyrosine decarboxylase-like PLP-dependent enzyme
LRLENTNYKHVNKNLQIICIDYDLIQDRGALNIFYFFFAYFPSNNSIPGFLGEMLSATLNIVGFSWITSPNATEFESIVLDWHTKALLLPQYFLSNGKVLDDYFYEYEVLP